MCDITKGRFPERLKSGASDRRRQKTLSIHPNQLFSLFFFFNSSDLPQRFAGGCKQRAKRVFSGETFLLKISTSLFSLPGSTFLHNMKRVN